MSHAENKLDWCLKKAEKEGLKHRGIRKNNPNILESNKHIKKAEHNLKTMIYLIKGNIFDWAVSCSFYSMYHCLLALLAKHGFESRNQECTFAAIEYLIEEKKIGIDLNKIRKISSLEGTYSTDIITLREEFQYGTRTVLEHEKIKKLLEETKEFIELTRVELKD